MKALAARLWSSLRTAPTPRDWLEAAAGLAILALLGACTLGTGLVHYAPVQAPQALKIAAIALVAPAIGEELVFRGWLPNWRETRRPTTWLLTALALFVFWHVVEAALIPRFQPIFLRRDFLAFATALGLVCGLLRMRSGSLWPGVAVHWVVVVVWLTCLGGPQVL